MRRLVRGVLAVSAAATMLVTAGCSDTKSPGSDAAGNQATVQKVTYLTGLGLLGREAYVFVAKDKGYFQEVGLDVEVKPGSGTVKNLQLLASGEVDFATIDIAAGLIEYGNGKNKDFKVVSAIQQRTVSCIMALEGSGITNPSDLAGKTIGYVPGGTNYTLFPLYAKLAGFDPKTVKWVNTPSPQLQQVLAAGQVNAITQLVVGKPTVELAARGKTAVVLPYSNYLTDLYGNGLAVSTKTLGERRDLALKFNEAMLKGLQYSIDNPAEAGQIFVKYNKQANPEAAAAEMELMKPYVLGGVKIGALDAARIARGIAFLQGSGTITPGVNPTDVVDYGLVP